MLIWADGPQESATALRDSILDWAAGDIQIRKGFKVGVQNFVTLWSCNSGTNACQSTQLYDCLVAPSRLTAIVPFCTRVSA